MPFFATVERGLLRHVFLKTLYTPAWPMQLGLANAAGDELLDQPDNAPGYDRVSSINPADFSEPMAGGMNENEVSFTFPAATADWSQEAVWANLYDANYDLFASYVLDPYCTAQEGEVPVVLAGALKTVMANYSMSTEYEHVVPGVTGHNAFSDYLKGRLLNHFFGKEAYTPPDIWVGLLTSDPGDDLTNTDCNEVQWGLGNYMRIPTSPSTWEVAIVDTWNSVEILFMEATVDWGEINHFALFDVWSPLEEGHALFHGPIEPKVIAAGSRSKFNITVPTVDAGVYEELGIGFTIL